MANRFLIVRKDLNLDEVVIESDGLTIGRLTGNDLVLNHPTVSRTQAGIKQVGDQLWIFNLSNANGTLLNGALIDKTPLVDGDVIQIGPFVLTPVSRESGLHIEVELTVNPLFVEASLAGATDKPSDSTSTVLLNVGALGQPPVRPSDFLTERISDLGALTSGQIAGLDEDALKVFWEKRKREAGKLTSESPLQPRSRIRLGKAQFNWRPTRDLVRLWPVALFVWAGILVGAASVGASFLFLDAFSPAPLSAAHTRAALSVEPAIAKRTNQGSCSSCHSLVSSMQQKCTDCHTTERFSAKLSDPHEKVGLTCLACHSDHHGADFRPALVASTACITCHRDGSGFVSPATGKPLTTPHGGTLGYPVSDGLWTWSGISERQWAARGLIGRAGDFSVKDQFHLVHLAGKGQGRSNCSDCHTSGVETTKLMQGVRESCSGCYGVQASAVAAGIDASTPNCVSCHSQHGEERNFRASSRRAIPN